MFNRGDIIRPTDGNRYGLPTTMRFLVRRVLSPIHIRVTIVDTSGGVNYRVGQEFVLDASEFELAKPKTERKELSMWVDKEGNGIKFADMDLAHLLNVVAMLHRKEGKKNEQRSKLVSLEKELAKRLQKRLA